MAFRKDPHWWRGAAWQVSILLEDRHHPERHHPERHHPERHRGGRDGRG